MIHELMILSSIPLSLTIAGMVAYQINREFAHQATRRKLGLSHDNTHWHILFRKIEKRLSFRRKDVINNFIHAGIYRAELAAWYVPAKLLLGAGLIIGIWLFSEWLGLTESHQRLMATMGALIMAIIGPDLLLQVRQRRRVRKVASLLPYMIDLMAVCIQTGMTIEAAIAYLGQELETFDKDLAWLMRQTDARSRVVNLPTALAELMAEFPCNEMRSFVYTLSQSLQYGSSIYEVLTSLSTNIREIQVLDLEEKVGQLSAKMSLPLILLIMFPVVILITAPSIMRMMSDG